ncbi:DJ-1/PfpI family protein [Phototrophicus methaneseepsis]|uniref:DJ-1/PfpI family protein n=1 Tax=Phototrophicus methaneseepsis TaxID=2710758 RepID=A0A7S8ECW2_9CHLR|nr:DJ-1/PfpI family protein [Phototrophicus methaneseepsis]QPC84648.1 DJ-1/PfpI family protein [Phototrophicus methaneseepsis]
MTEKRNVAIFIFEDVEILDFAGPYEAFAVCGVDDGEPLFNVYTASLDGKSLLARNGLSINPAYSIETMPQPDILLIPGGQGTRPLVGNEAIRQFIQAQQPQVEQLLSVCTGALLLADAGVLANQSATTYHTAFDLLHSIDGSISLQPGQRWVDNGQIVTSAGVSAGIDMSLYVISKLFDQATADATARHMEYEHWPLTKINE